MTSLDNLSAALDSLGTDVQQAATDVSAKLAELIAEIQTLTAGSISQDQIDALAAKATAADDAVKALDAAAQAATA